MLCKNFEINRDWIINKHIIFKSAYNSLTKIIGQQVEEQVHSRLKRSAQATLLKYRNWLRDGRSSATGMLDRSMLVGKRFRESGGVRYAGFRVLRGGEEPRQHGTRAVVEKQPTAAPEYTVSPLRRSLAALGQSSLQRSSALTVFRMAMRRSNFSDTTSKFIIDPAQNFIACNIIEDILKPRFEVYHRKNTGERDSASRLEIVVRRLRDIFIGKLIAFDIRGDEKIEKDTINEIITNSALFVNACLKFFNERNITLFDSDKLSRKWRIKNKLTIVLDWNIEKIFFDNIVLSKKCQHKEDDIGEIINDLKFSSVKPKRDIFSNEVAHFIERKSKDTIFIENIEHIVAIDVLFIVYISGFIATGVHIATAYAPRTCHVSHAGGPTRTYGPPIAPQLDDRVSVTLDFHASAGPGLPGTIPTFCFTHFRRFSAFLSFRVRTFRADYRQIDRSEFSLKSTRNRYELPTLQWNVRVVWTNIEKMFSVINLWSFFFDNYIFISEKYSEKFRKHLL